MIARLRPDPSPSAYQQRGIAGMKNKEMRKKRVERGFMIHFCFSSFISET